MPKTDAPPDPLAPEIMQRIKKALMDDMAVNRSPDPKTVPQVLVAYDPATQLFRIAHARFLDLTVQIVYLRSCDIKMQMSKVMQLEAAAESSVNEEYGRAMSGQFDPVVKLGLES